MATDILPQNSLGIRVMQAKRGSIGFTAEGHIYDLEDTGEVLVEVKPTGLEITKAGAIVIMQNIMNMELSHKEFAITRELVKPRKPKAATGGKLSSADMLAELNAVLETTE